MAGDPPRAELQPMQITTAPRLLAAALVALAVLPAAPGGAARKAAYVVETTSQPASSGLRPTGPLGDMRAVARGRFVVPSTWTRLSSRAGELRFRTAGTSSCKYVVGLAIVARAAAPGDAATRVAATLPNPGPRYVIDEGVRSGHAWKVLRRPSSGDPRVHVIGARSGVLTRRDDVAPAGHVVVYDVTASAVSRAGDECHAGTWREAVGPQLADVLATTRTSLRFVKP